MRKSQTRSRMLGWVLCIFLSACSTVERPPSSGCPVCAPCPGAPAVEAPPARPLQPAPWSDLPGWGDDDLTAAWPAFLQSCRGMAGKPNGLQWRAVCEEARKLPATDGARLRRFFETRFEPFLLTNPDGSTRGLVTGYYEPLLNGSRERTARFTHPVLGVPPDLLTIDLSDVAPELKDLKLRGRLVGNRVVPYYSRGQIADRALEKVFPDRVLVWVDDAVELFFLQIQGSGRVRLPDGRFVRLAYADQNGHPYKSIGRLLAEQGQLPAEQASMQAIQAWARTHPAQLRELLDRNPRYVFFREIPEAGNGTDGPPGALGVPLSPGRSLAVDPRYVPLGAPVFLAATPEGGEPLQRLMHAQDTGSAIRGVVRADFFWGFGPEAGERAGRMKAPGRMWVLLPRAALP